MESLVQSSHSNIEEAEVPLSGKLLDLSASHVVMFRSYSIVSGVKCETMFTKGFIWLVHEIRTGERTIIKQ